MVSLRSTSLVTNEAGAIQSSQRHSAYGAVRSQSGELPTDHTFTGLKVDGTGLIYYRARYYDPQLGTFISPDTIVPDPGLVIDYNRYAYTRGNPLRYNDPSGHIVETVWDAANVAIGVGSLGYNLWNGNWGDAAWDAGGLVVDAAATVVPFIPGGAATALKVSRSADKVVDAVRTVSHVADINNGARSAWFANRLRQVGQYSDEGLGIVRKLASDFTKGSGDRVVLGRWKGGVGDYIEEATTNGGVFFSTPSEYFPALGRGDIADDLAWAVNEQFLRNQLENGINRIELVGDTVRNILKRAPKSFTSKEIRFLQETAGDYGYIQVGNSWIKSQ